MMFGLAQMVSIGHLLTDSKTEIRHKPLLEKHHFHHEVNLDFANGTRISILWVELMQVHTSMMSGMLPHLMDNGLKQQQGTHQSGSVLDHRMD
jgi:hypothetical protein